MELKDFIRTTLDDITSALQESKAEIPLKEIPVRFELDIAAQAEKLDVVHGGAIGLPGFFKIERKVDNGTQEASTITHRLIFEISIRPPEKDSPFKGGPMRMKPARFR